MNIESHCGMVLVLALALVQGVVRIEQGLTWDAFMVHTSSRGTGLAYWCRIVLLKAYNTKVNWSKSFVDASL